MCGNSSQKISMRDSHAGFDIRMNKRSLYGGPGRWIGPRHAIAVREAKDSGCRASNRDPTSSSDAIIQTRLAARDGTGRAWQSVRHVGGRRGGCTVAARAASPGPLYFAWGCFRDFCPSPPVGPLMARRRRACARDARFFARRIDAHAALLPYAPVMKKRCFA